MGDFLTKIGRSVSRATGRTGLVIKKKSPELLFIAGVVTFAGTIIAASRATLKADEILEYHRQKMKDIDDAKKVADENPEDPEYDYEDELYVEDRRKQTLKTACEMIKIYAPVAALGGLSIACFLTSRNIMQRRYLGVVAAYNTLNEVINTYRKRVREELGDDMDRHFRYGTEYKEVKEEVVDDDGKKHKETVKESHTDLNLPNSSAVFFDESNPNWDPNPHFSMTFLRAQQNYWNDILHARGHVFLNEVLQNLGFEHTPEGAVLGWIDGYGDNCVDFGLYDAEKENVRNFVNGKTNTILLEFNHDGPIWDKI